VTLSRISDLPHALRDCQLLTRRLDSRRPVVFLDAELSEIARRVGFDAPRPLLAVNPRAELSRLLSERRPHNQAPP